MLETIEQLIQVHPDRTTFFSVIGRIFPRHSHEFHLIEFAYNTAKKEFRDKYRVRGERYFEHLRRVVLIIVLYLGVRDVNIIVGAILHDIMEDIPGWTQDRLAQRFNSDVAQLVFWVSEEDLAYYNEDKRMRDFEFHCKLSEAPREAQILKLPDRLDNLMTLWAMDIESQKRKVDETYNVYLPLARRFSILYREILAALQKVERSWNDSSNQQTIKF
ncbi:MAG: HD domain-containing protein [Candidatus Pacebacteria bacterium]|nr:HD domain-containing protein [Candidatus Paceibacterota bacterium]MCF7857221.1 HD domain-containing protein [Candidatus Paceibacterota bacterium]